jgi:hypothetical protein
MSMFLIPRQGLGVVSMSSIPIEGTGKQRPGERREAARFGGEEHGCRYSIVAASDGVGGVQEYT